MDTNKTRFNTVDEYLATLPQDKQALLQSIRDSVKAAIPNIQEGISYQMPVFILDGGKLINFAAWKNHVGVYPLSGEALDNFKDELAGYVAEKGSVQFPNSQPLPLDLITRMVQFRIDQNREKSAAKSAKKKA